jgi:hypothetical protein
MMVGAFGKGGREEEDRIQRCEGMALHSPEDHHLLADDNLAIKVSPASGAPPNRRRRPRIR